MCEFACIAGVSSDWGIGYRNDLPWKGTQIGRLDMRFFKAKTLGHVVIMGRATAESIPTENFPLCGRVNIVLSSKERGVTSFGVSTDTPLYYVSNLQTALDVASLYTEKDKYIIGGAMLYAQALRHPQCTKVIISLLGVDCPCDAFIDPSPFAGWCYEDTWFVSYTVREYSRFNMGFE